MLKLAVDLDAYASLFVLLKRKFLKAAMGKWRYSNITIWNMIIRVDKKRDNKGGRVNYKTKQNKTNTLF